MITGYLELLQRRYQGQLDQDADQFIDYAVDGAERMKALINDLLAYSRVSTRGRPFAPTEVGPVLDQVLAGLHLVIAGNDAVITHDPLPTVPADEVQLAQLFQNLIENALKFRGEAPPRIHIGAKETDTGWQFAVRDNGIGFEQKYADRVFVLFQRLHTREEYTGTGIGLAICQKIVERHGGRIWVESEPGEGTTFYFTLPGI
jgi:light-regulated signal transduction histidine kinase (bacteriophytochrome)